MERPVDENSIHNELLATLHRHVEYRGYRRRGWEYPQGNVVAISFMAELELRVIIHLVPLGSVLNRFARPRRGKLLLHADRFTLIFR